MLGIAVQFAITVSVRWGGLPAIPLVNSSTDLRSVIGLGEEPMAQDDTVADDTAAASRAAWLCRLANESAWLVGEFESIHTAWPAVLRK